MLTIREWQPGMSMCFTVTNRLSIILAWISESVRLFNIGGELSAPECDLTHAAEIIWLETWIDHFNAGLPALEDFIISGGDICVAQCHIARTVCRRTERHLVHWSRDHDVREELLKYINRLSDLLFVLARVLESERGHQPTLWNKHLVLPQPD